tara:strand:- start:1575 stop:1991 length:417 start_codon:yes stop_codon:yes gene_type:complete
MIDKINISNTTLSTFKDRHRKFDAKQAKRHDFGQAHCVNCDEVFIKNHPRAKLCSEVCKRERKNVMERRYCEKNPEKTLAYRRKWNKENAEKNREYSRKHYRNNLEKKRAKCREYYKKNREKILAQKRESYKKNKWQE